MSPEKRVYLASSQPQTMVAIHSIPQWDLYVVYEGTNPDTGNPIIKAFLNPLVGWIWAGVVFIVFGTFVALVPSLSPSTAAYAPPPCAQYRPSPRSKEATDVRSHNHDHAKLVSKTKQRVGS